MRKRNMVSLAQKDNVQKQMMQERNARSGQGLSKVKDQYQESIQTDQSEVSETIEKEKKVTRMLGGK